MDYKRSEIVWVNLDPTRKGEQGKTRPCVIISHDGMNHSRHPCVIVCPLTDKKNVHRQYSTHALLKSDAIEGLAKDSVVMAEQIRVVAKSRIEKSRNPLSLSKQKMQTIENALRRALDLL